jgi:hypothetical protein
MCDSSSTRTPLNGSRPRGANERSVDSPAGDPFSLANCVLPGTDVDRDGAAAHRALSIPAGQRPARLAFGAALEAQPGGAALSERGRHRRLGLTAGPRPGVTGERLSLRMLENFEPSRQPADCPDRLD